MSEEKRVAALPNIDIARQHELARRLVNAQTAAEYYFIDVVGTCNLRCPSCAVGNMPALFAKGLMSKDTLEAVLAKIRRETEGIGRIFIDLYNWGEPMLHPDIGDIIRMVKDAGFGCGVSSNLVAGKHLADVVKAKPDYLRISLSGYHNATYQQTHAGGDVNLVKAHMHLLRYYLDSYRNTDTVVQVGFHVYKTNFPDDFHRMLALSDELGFLFSPTLATIMPVEKAVAALEDEGLTDQDRALLDKLVISPKRWRQINLESDITLPDCQYRSQRTTINYDGSVALCCATYGSDKIVADDFLANDNAALVAARQAHDYCRTCMGHRLHYVYTGAYPSALEEEAVRVLGDDYAAYLAATRLVGDPGVVVYDGELRKIDDVYAQGIAALSGGDTEAFEKAEKCFDALVAGAPQFGEGVYQAAAVKQRLGRREDAARLAVRALELTPDNAAYRALAEQFQAE